MPKPAATVLPARISVFGLGYVGCVTVACLASRGHYLTGVDVQRDKAERLKRGEPTIAEPGLDALLREAHRSGRLAATTEVREAISATDISIVCVGTPSTPSGALDLSYVNRVTGEIAEALSAAGKPSHTLIYRSTMLPGATRTLAEGPLAPLIEAGALETWFLPEFLRQGSAVADFVAPSLSAIGSAEPEKSDLTRVASVLPTELPTAHVSFETAELLKYACNAFHALKVGFANEIGRIAKAGGIDGAAVMELLCEDKRLNISPYYLRPGTPFGGSCLPKDVSALRHFARERSVPAQLIEGTLESNEQHLCHLLERVELSGKRRVLLVGLAFKSDTDDLRGSAAVELAAALLLQGYDLQIYDPAVSPRNLFGANRRFARLRLPALDGLLTADLGAALDASDLLVVFKACADPETLRARLTAEHAVIDVNGWEILRHLPGQYDGLCWP